MDSDAYLVQTYIFVSSIAGKVVRLGSESLQPPTKSNI